MDVCVNNKIKHDYFILDKYEAGIKLKGSEIKSIRLGNVNIKDSYVIYKKGVMQIINMHVKKYEQANIFNHDELRPRELLLHKKEILKLEQKRKLERLTIIPYKLYFKGGILKVEICLCKGKKLYDKRNDLKEKDELMHQKKLLKNFR